MDIVSGPTQGAGGEICGAVSRTRGFTRILRDWFQSVSRILRISSASPEESNAAESRSNSRFNCAADEVLTQPIVENLRKQELGKTVLGVAVPVTAGLIIYFSTHESPPPTVRFTVVALSIGCTAIWNGLLLPETYPLTANAAEQVGVAIVLLAFHGLVGSFLPPEHLWIPGLFGSLTVVPFVLAAFPPNQ